MKREDVRTLMAVILTLCALVSAIGVAAACFYVMMFSGMEHDKAKETAAGVFLIGGTVVGVMGVAAAAFWEKEKEEKKDDKTDKTE